MGQFVSNALLWASRVHLPYVYTFIAKKIVKNRDDSGIEDYYDLRIRYLPSAQSAKDTTRKESPQEKVISLDPAAVVAFVKYNIELVCMRRDLLKLIRILQIQRENALIKLVVARLRKTHPSHEIPLSNLVEITQDNYHRDDEKLWKNNPPPLKFQENICHIM